MTPADVRDLATEMGLSLLEWAGIPFDDTGQVLRFVDALTHSSIPEACADIGGQFTGTEQTWACCTSSIGPPCGHRTAGFNRGDADGTATTG